MKVEYVHTADGRKITCFDRACMAGGKAATKPVGHSFDGSEPATRWKGIK